MITDGVPPKAGDAPFGRTDFIFSSLHFLGCSTKVQRRKVEFGRGAGRRLCLKTASWGVGDISQLLWNGGYVEKQPCFPVFPQLFQMSSLKVGFFLKMCIPDSGAFRVS